jgi:hypothetical protein
MIIFGFDLGCCLRIGRWWKENEVMVVLMEEEFNDTNCEVLVKKNEEVMNIEDVTMSLNFLVDVFIFINRRVFRERESWKSEFD